MNEAEWPQLLLCQMFAFWAQDSDLQVDPARDMCDCGLRASVQLYRQIKKRNDRCSVKQVLPLLQRNFCGLQHVPPKTDVRHCYELCDLQTGTNSSNQH